MPPSAVRADDFLNTLGVDTHIDYTDGQYADITADIADLQYLGITNVRDAAPNPANQGQANLGLAADAGIKFIFYADGSVDPALVVQQLDDFIRAHPGSITDIEGPNEVNNQPVTYQELTGTAAAQAYQLALFNDVKADPLLSGIPVLGFTDYPNESSASDLNNIHPYAQNGEQPLDTILSNEAAQDAVEPGKPFVITETGYHTFTVGAAGGGSGAVDDNTQAELILNSYMDAVALGVKATYIYQLLDAYSDPGGTNPEDHYGLFNLDNSPKPAAVAIHDLTTILQDSGANATSFAAGSLNYSISNLPATANSYLTEKSNGTFDVMIWNEPDVWDSTNDQPITVPTTDVTVSLGQTFTTVQIFDPVVGTTPVQTLYNVSAVDLGLSDHLLIVQASGEVNSPTGTVIEADGSTSLVQVGDVFDLDNISTGTGPSLQNVVAGQLGGWTPIGAEQTATGYEVAWEIPSTDQYSIWTTDSSGNYVSSTGILSGNSATLEAYETSFHQDLNGDGIIGPGTTVIEADGSTSLVQVGDVFDLDNISTGTGPSLQNVVAGQLGGWTPIGAEQTATGYEVAWEIPSTDQYSIWTTDSSGNYVSSTGILSGNSATLEAYETSFHQDLNGDGIIGPGTTVIEADGLTSLVQVGDVFDLDNISTGTGPSLQNVVAGQLGGWTPIGAEQTATGYEVAWEIPSTDQYSIWTTDSSGNYVSSTGILSGNSATLEAYETSFHQDLNGDGIIGPGTTVIEADGSTSLVQVGDVFDLDNISTGTGPSLQNVVAGQLGGWTPIGAEQTATGYEVAWEIPSTDQYSIWTTDSSGNYVSSTGILSGNSATLEAYETSFHQDLNGDGIVGANATVNAGATIDLTGESDVDVQFASTTGTLELDHSTTFGGQIYGFTGNGSLSGSDQIDLKDIIFSSGVSESYTGNSTGGVLTVSDRENDTANISLTGNYVGSTFTLSGDGQGGTIVIDPVASDLASGILSFGKFNPADMYSIEISPEGGDFAHLGNFTAVTVTKTNDRLAVEWHFNLNPSTISHEVTQSYDVSLIDSQPEGTSQTTSQIASVMVGGAANDSFIFSPRIGADIVSNAKGTDVVDPRSGSSFADDHLSAVLQEAQISELHALLASTNKGQDTMTDLVNHDSITPSHVQFTNMHASNFILS